MTTFTAESKEAARDFFKRYTESENGTLRTAQLLEALSAFGCDVNEDGIKFIKQQFDMDGDGRIQVEELVDNLESLIQYSVDGEQLEEAFKKLDLNGDGKISSRELKKVLKMPGPYAMKEEEASELVLYLLEKYDTNGDKYFSYSEFVKMLRGEDLQPSEFTKALKSS